MTRKSIGNPGAFRIVEDCEVGEETIVRDFTHLIRCTIGRRCKIGTFVEIQKGVTIGDNCKIEPFAFIPQGVTIGNEVFIGPHACFTNDRNPKAQGDWTMEKTQVKDGASVGAGAVILPGVTIGRGATVGAGSVVTEDVPDGATVYGEKATPRRIVCGAPLKTKVKSVGGPVMVNPGDPCTLTASFPDGRCHHHTRFKGAGR